MSRGKHLSQQLNTMFGGGAAYKAVAFLILLLLLMGAYNANVSYAWFTDSHQEDFSLVSGKVHYDVSFITAEDKKMVPGVNLIDDIKITNKSTIDTDFRIAVSYNYYVTEGGIVSQSAIYQMNASATAIYDNSGKLTGWEADNISKTQYMNITMDTTKFKPADSEGWFEYTTTVPAITGPALDVGADNLPVGQVIPVFKEGNFVFCYDGAKTGPIFEGQPIVLTIGLQAKQAAHVEWENLTVVLPYSG